MIRQTVTAAVLASAAVLATVLAAQGATVLAAQGATAPPAATPPSQHQAARAASRTDSSRTDSSRTDGSRTDGSRTGASRTGASRTGGWQARLSPAELASAAGRCATWAADAGFANNGYLAGSLTTAVAVALAESGCDPAACFDNTTKSSCTPPGPAADSVDRGAWQLNSKVPGAASDKCAFSGPCAARAAYGTESQDGTFFAAWVRYQTDFFAGFLPAAQTAVNALRAGTVTSGINGSCLGYPKDKVNAGAILENCGSGAADQIWKISGNTLRTSRGLCLAARSASRLGPAVLRHCTGSSLQSWQSRGHAALRDAGARRCLNDPGGADKPGAVIGVARCTGARDQTWYRP